MSSLEETLARVNKLIETTNPVGTFYATRSSNLVVLAGSTIPFDSVHYNPDGDYDPIMGVFICPLDGTYVVHLCIVGTASVTADVYKAGTSQLRVYSGNHNNANGSGMAVFHCTMGETVNVRSASTGTVRGEYMSTFSGFMQHADPL
eukprot:GHVU01162011.1.p1 GENE.GHVU01162011.1~~GHVU01162011.1.p1  ORF type:complete len:165 (-),score=10.12 GHVU01162011.1:1-441(-)